MDDYAKEISDLETQIEEMVEAEGDARTIAELEMQLDILKTIYARASELYEAGLDDSEMRSGLAMRGFGEWSLDNVYAFVYETAVDLPVNGHGAFLGGIRETDFAGMLH
jgi:hypothetical protein